MFIIIFILFALALALTIYSCIKHKKDKNKKYFFINIIITIGLFLLGVVINHINANQPAKNAPAIFHIRLGQTTPVVNDYFYNENIKILYNDKEFDSIYISHFNKE